MTRILRRPLRAMADLQIRHRWLVGLFAVMAAVLIAIPIIGYVRSSPPKDYGKWVEVGLVVLQDGELYPDATKTKHLPYMYPPTFAILMAPLAAAGLLTTIMVLALVFTASWFALILVSVYLVTGRFRVGQWRLYVLPSLICLAYLHDSYLLGQPNIVLIACLVGAFGCLRLPNRGAHIGAGALIAFAASMKAFPVLAVPYLVWRRYWTALAATVIWLAVLLVLVPAPVRGLQRSVTELKTWSSAMVFKYDESGIAQRRVRGNSWKNQSMIAVANRVLRRLDASPDLEGKFVNVANLSFRTVSVILLAAAAVLGLVYVLAMPPERLRTIETDAIETAMLTLLILMVTPLSFIYFYVWLIYPLTVGLYLCIGHPDSNLGRDDWKRDWGITSAPWLAIYLVVLLLLAAGLPSHTLRAMGNTFWASLVLFGGFAWELFRRRRQTDGR